MMTEESRRAVIDIDMRGQVCPATLLVALDAINRHADGLRNGAERLCIRTDNRDATNTIPDIARNMGYAVTVTREEECYRICLSLPE